MQGITFLPLTTVTPPNLSISGQGFALPAGPFAEPVAETGGDRAVTPPCKQKQNLSRPWSTQIFALWALLFSVHRLFCFLWCLCCCRGSSTNLLFLPGLVFVAGVCCDKILMGRRKESSVLWLALPLVIFQVGSTKRITGWFKNQPRSRWRV